jgi:hypothetical protein
VKVEANQAVYHQHRGVRQIVEGATRRPWPEFSNEALIEWLARRPDLAG